MKKITIFLIGALLFANSVNLNAQTDGCTFRFLLVSPPGFGWPSTHGIAVTVDDIEFGVVTLPWGTPSAEYTLLLPSGEVHFLWINDKLFTPAQHYFEIYNSLNELIYTSPDTPGLPELFFTYQNVCCIALTDFEGEYNQETKQVNLSWVAPTSVDLTGFNIYRNDELLASVDSSTNTFSTQTVGLQTGKYKYCVTPVYPFTCTFEEECFEIDIEVGIKYYASNLHIYPNPTNSELRITNYELRITDVKIFDVMGKMQKCRKAEKQNFEREMVIDISNLSNGIYFVDITTEKGIVTKKVIKQ